jgi:hypothetical protein
MEQAVVFKDAEKERRGWEREEVDCCNIIVKQRLCILLLCVCVCRCEKLYILRIIPRSDYARLHLTSFCV